MNIQEELIYTSTWTKCKFIHTKQCKGSAKRIGCDTLRQNFGSATGSLKNSRTLLQPDGFSGMNTRHGVMLNDAPNAGNNPVSCVHIVWPFIYMYTMRSFTSCDCVLPPRREYMLRIISLSQIYRLTNYFLSLFRCRSSAVWSVVYAGCPFVRASE